MLSKAIEYIAHLENRSKTLSKENQHQKARIDALETLLMGQSNVGRPIYEIGRRSVQNLPPLHVVLRDIHEGQRTDTDVEIARGSFVPTKICPVNSRR